MGILQWSKNETGNETNLRSENKPKLNKIKILYKYNAMAFQLAIELAIQAALNRVNKGFNKKSTF